MHKILDVDLGRLRAWITDKCINDEIVKLFMGKNRRYFSETCLCVIDGWQMSTKEMGSILLPIRELVPDLLDSTRFFAKRGGSSTHKERWPLVIVNSIPLPRNNSDCGVFTIKYFEYVAASFDLVTLCQENISYFRKTIGISIMDQHSYVLNFVARFVGVVYHVCCEICT
ncbi:hypothetical protein IC582_004206 [Cucumis melo]